MGSYAEEVLFESNNSDNTETNAAPESIDFKCPGCGHHRVQEIGIADRVYTELEGLVYDERTHTADCDYGDIQYGDEFTTIGYQCYGCGLALGSADNLADLCKFIKGGYEDDKE